MDHDEARQLNPTHAETKCEFWRYAPNLASISQGLVLLGITSRKQPRSLGAGFSYPALLVSLS